MKQTIDRRKRYDLKNNRVAKTYKLDKELVEAFSKKCNANAVSQSSMLSQLMSDYIKQN